MTQSRSPKGWSYKHRGPKIWKKVDVPKRMELQTSRSQILEKVDVPKRMELQTSRSQKGTKSRRPQKDGGTNIEVPKGDKKSRSQVRLRSGDGAPQGWRNMGATWRNRVGSWKWRFGGERVAKPGAAFSVSFRATFRGVPPFLTLSSFLSLSPASVSAFSLSLLCPITPKNPRACAHLDCVLTSGTHPSFRPFF
jgi:hypothetical protein